MAASLVTFRQSFQVAIYGYGSDLSVWLICGLESRPRLPSAYVRNHFDLGERTWNICPPHALVIVHKGLFWTASTISFIRAIYRSMGRVFVGRTITPNLGKLISVSALSFIR